MGPLWATVAAVPYAVLVGRKDGLRTAYEASCVAIEIYLAGIVFSFASGPLLAAAPESTATAVYAALAAGVTMVSVNSALNVGLLQVKYRETFEEIWKEGIEPYLLPHAVAVLTVGLGILILLTRGPVAALVVVAGSLGSQVLVYRSREQVEGERGVAGAGGVSGGGPRDLQHDVRDHDHPGPWCAGTATRTATRRPRRCTRRTWRAR